MKILIIDDDENVRHSLMALLNRAGHETLEWPGSTDAEKEIKRLQPDIVLTDHNFLPGEEKGLDLADRLIINGVNVVLMSASPLIKYEARKRGIPFHFKLAPIPELFAMLQEVCHA